MIKLQHPKAPATYSIDICEKAIATQEEERLRSISSMMTTEEATILKALSIPHNSCAYCETQLDNNFNTRDRRIDLFDSRTPEKINLYAWTNLVLACGTCHFYKGPKHPRDNSGELLLINPYRDEPEDHLLALPNCHYGALTEKGEFSIRVYGLNRNSLIAERRADPKAFPGFQANLKYNEGKTPLPKIDYDLSTILDKRRYK